MGIAYEDGGGIGALLAVSDESAVQRRQNRRQVQAGLEVDAIHRLQSATSEPSVALCVTSSNMRLEWRGNYLHPRIKQVPREVNDALIDEDVLRTVGVAQRRQVALERVAHRQHVVTHVAVSNLAAGFLRPPDALLRTPVNMYPRLNDGRRNWEVLGRKGKEEFEKGRTLPEWPEMVVRRVGTTPRRSSDCS